MIRPTLIHLCGIPGAGKTTYANALHKVRRDLACLQFDAVMEQLPGYQIDKSRLGLQQAFERWELQARVIGYELFHGLVSGGRDILFDHSASSRLHLDLIRDVQSKGYIVEMHYIECTPEEAIRRVKRRSSQRYTPEQLVYERHKLILELLPAYKELVDKFVTIVQPFSSTPDEFDLLKRTYRNAAAANNSAATTTSSSLSSEKPLDGSGNYV